MQLLTIIKSFAGPEVDQNNNNNQCLKDIIDGIVMENTNDQIVEFTNELHSNAASSIMMPSDFRNSLKSLQLKVDAELL